jgi:hypothetical protein
MKRHTISLLGLIITFVLFASCQSTDEKRLKQELAKKDSIIDMQKKIIDGKKNNYDLDKIKPIVVPKNTNIKFGDSYSADIFLAAFNSKEQFEVYLCESIDTVNNKMTGRIDTLKVNDGSAKINLHPKNRGKQIIHGLLVFKGINYFFTKEYNVY